MKVYFISGLAADETVFRHIILPQQYEAVHIPWLEPLPNESLHDYALRMAQKIDTSEKFSLIGLSFGGMISTEIANHFRPEHTILISSVPMPAHFPFWFGLSRRLRLHKLLPIAIIKHAARFKRFFTKESAADKKMLTHMIMNSDSGFIRWAMDAALSWKNTEVPPNLFHIHGTSDEVLPGRYTRPTHLIRGGGHLMVMNKGRQISSILKTILG